MYFENLLTGETAEWINKIRIKTMPFTAWNNKLFRESFFMKENEAEEWRISKNNSRWPKHTIKCYKVNNSVSKHGL